MERCRERKSDACILGRSVEEENFIDVVNLSVNSLPKIPT